MKRLVTLAALAAFLTCGLAYGEEPGPNYEHLKPMEWIIGEWTLKLEEPTEDPVEIVAKYNWGLNKNVVQYHFVVRRSGVSTLEVIGTMGWYAEKEQVVSTSFNTEGGRTESTVTFPNKDTVADKARWISPSGEITDHAYSTERIDQNTIVSKVAGRDDWEFKRKK